MSLKVRTFKVSKLNSFLGIVIMVVLLSTMFVSFKLAYGKSGNLTMKQTNGLAQNQTEVYVDVLTDVIKNANITIPPDLHLTTRHLEKIAHEIVEGGHPNKILNDIRQNKS